MISRTIVFCGKQSKQNEFCNDAESAEIVTGGEEIWRKATDHDSSDISSRHITINSTISRQKSPVIIKSLW